MPVARTADGADIEWEEHGSGEPLLLIAGQGVSRRTWDLLIPALSPEFRVITYDHRGIGPSTLGDAPEWTTRALASDAITVLDAADVDRAHVVGHSMGGRIGQWLAIDHPERMASLTLISSTGGDARGHARPTHATAALAGGDLAVLGPYFFGDAFRTEHPHVLGMLARSDAPIRARRGHFQASSTHDAWDDLGGIPVPTLVIHGTDDEITLIANGRDLAARIPGAVFLEVPGGHGIHLESPAVRDAILAFARAHPI
ncbi:alpha/beta fold hydrolase [Microbacterium sp. ASV49]|uniref:Alpha/beta fold hydrolase n=1 Tax=Microbacterium candidum TaxID=3041922 RepID=A0ABT7MXP0_9MICO|nr:alpha/beta fold hydrolase [Microbacterium sp. ASV49]MDL9979227.1 alpha/beta fold hydrolase [Microbacterium sp. ASV49]